MEILQWTMHIPGNKRQEFIRFHRKVLGPTEAWELSRAYEKKFKATNIELTTLVSPLESV
jgi:hypothetical protein